MLKKSGWKYVATTSLACIMLFLASSCSTPGASEPDALHEDSSDRPETSALANELSGTGNSQDTVSPSGTEAPAWAEMTEEDGQLFEGLNLDGVGEEDDAVYISTCKFGDYHDKMTAVRVHLGTGETMAEMFPIYGHFSLQTGHLFSEEKDAIVLEVMDGTSNYGAANIFALDVFPIGADAVPQIAVRMDTTTGTILSADGTKLIEEDRDLITDGTQIIDIDVDGETVQGLKIFLTGDSGEWRGRYSILLWTGNNTWANDGWTLITSGETEYSAQS